MLTCEKVPEWCDSIKKVEWASKGKVKVGATVHVLSEIAGLKGEWDAEMTELLDNQSLSWRTTSGNPTIIYHAILTPTKNGSKLTIGFDYDMPREILGKIVDRLRFHKAIEKEAENALRKMKNIAEKNELKGRIGALI